MPMRVNVTIKGELEEYVKQEMLRTGEAAGTICKGLCDCGMDYKRGLKTMAVLAATIEKENARKGE